jgi:secreted Zn-dependent insulinase-like peptidase
MSSFHAQIKNSNGGQNGCTKSGGTMWYFSTVSRDAFYVLVRGE